jgi:hypothetical protein
MIRFTSLHYDFLDHLSSRGQPKRIASNAGAQDKDGIIYCKILPAFGNVCDNTPSIGFKAEAKHENFIAQNQEFINDQSVWKPWLTLTTKFGHPVHLYTIDQLLTRDFQGILQKISGKCVNVVRFCCHIDDSST